MASSSVAVVALLALLSASSAATAKLVQEKVELPVDVTDASGGTVSHRIVVTIFRDDAYAKSPFLVVNHGRSSDPEKRAAVRPAQFAANARLFVAKGFAVFFPVRIGYGATGGPDIENSGPCATKSYRSGFEAAADQTLKVIEHAKSLPYIDAGNGFVTGVSFGGTTAVAIAARNVPGVKGTANFAGGGGGRPLTHPGQPCRPELMTELFAQYGSAARTPMLWLYSENDQYWGQKLPRIWHKAFTDRGGTGRLVELPPYKSDGHPIFTGNPAAWEPAIDDFLASCCRVAGKDAGTATAAAPPPPEPGAATQLSDRPEAFTQALAAWTARHKVKQAVVVVRRNGRIVHKAGIGGADPDGTYLLASLSKAITGACIATLVRGGKLTFETPLSSALAKFFSAHGKPRDPRIERITVAQLLTHRAGFSSASDGDDPASRSGLETHLARHSSRDAANPAYLSTVLAKGLLRDPGEQFAYSNAGYLVLGAVIEEATGQPYEEHCRDAVLKPAGAVGVLDPAWRIMSSYGGWRMSGESYLAFFEQLDPARTALGQPLQAWMLDKTGKAQGKTGSAVWYGPGIRMQQGAGGVEIWHTGSWRRRLAADTLGPRSADTSTLAVRLADGTSWFVHSTPLVQGPPRVELDREMRRAYRAVRSWN